jgi:hypothetical protein
VRDTRARAAGEDIDAGSVDSRVILTEAVGGVARATLAVATTAMTALRRQIESERVDTLAGVRRGCEQHRYWTLEILPPRGGQG